MGSVNLEAGISNGARALFYEQRPYAQRLLNSYGRGEFVVLVPVCSVVVVSICLPCFFLDFVVLLVVSMLWSVLPAASVSARVDVVVDSVLAFLPCFLVSVLVVVVSACADDGAVCASMTPTVKNDAKTTLFMRSPFRQTLRRASIPLDATVSSALLRATVLSH
jgi:hypothetical protein